jgi:serine phosphatase RsbU (regulator of sigma subunit)
VAALAETLGLHRFLWSRIACDGLAPVLMAGGFDQARASFHAPFGDYDAAHFNNAAQHVETLLANALLIAELRREKDQLRQAHLMIEQRDRELQEMELARRIQMALLPPSTHGLHAELDIAAVMLPADEVGGDYYDAALDRRGDLWLTIGDVSGHGLTPGLVMMMAQTAHSAIRSGNTATPTEMVVRLNRTLHENVAERLRSNLYMTFVALRYEGGGRFVHAGAHLQILIHRCGTGNVELLATLGTWLGIEADISDATIDYGFHLELGDTLVLYTDGLPESISPAGQMLDVAGLERLVRTHAHLPTKTMAEAMIKDVREWCADQRQDDMTVMVVRRVY